MEIAAENMDRLLCIEMRRKGLPRGFKWPLYEAARAISDGPMVLKAAQLLDRPPAKVGIFTGAAVPEHMPVGENDGPFGSAVLAGALARIGHAPTIYTDPVCAAPIEALLKRSGVVAPVVRLKLGDKAQLASAAAAEDILVAIERLGGNINGKLHGVNGTNRDAFRCNVDHAFHEATRLAKTTIGIGDGGNEVGFGRLRETLEACLPEFSQKDKTPCGGGIFSAIATDHLVVASTSNLGAYGVVAALAMLKNDPSLCHTAEEEIALHHVGVGLGLVDGGGGGLIPWCDGIPAESNAAVVTLLQNIVLRTLEAPRIRTF
ncbi:MAG: glutamate cyclase domain-containing protein [Burkholderiales bacterium]